MKKNNENQASGNDTHIKEGRRKRQKENSEEKKMMKRRRKGKYMPVICLGGRDWEGQGQEKKTPKFRGGRRGACLLTFSLPS